MVSPTLAVVVFLLLSITSGAESFAVPPRSRSTLASRCVLCCQGDANDEDEILLCLHLKIMKDTIDPPTAVAAVSKYCQSFPFAVVLPVQPLQYIPTAEGGVNITFLRKKTATKDAVDGGIVFDVTETSDEDDTIIEVTARRNAKGQVISKNVSEKLVITNFVAGLTGKKELGNPPPAEWVHVQSVFHRWM